MNTKRKLRSEIAARFPLQTRVVGEGTAESNGKNEGSGRQCCNRIRSPGSVNKITLTNRTSAPVIYPVLHGEWIGCTPFRRRRIKHHCSIKHHSTGLQLVERSPTLRHGLLLVRCRRRTLPGSMRPRPRCTSAHPRPIKDYARYPIGALAG